MGSKGGRCGLAGEQVYTHAVSTKKQGGGIGILGCHLIISAVTLKMHKCCLNAIQEMQLAVIRAKIREWGGGPPTNQSASRIRKG